MLILIIRAFVLYIFVILVMRLMGKREIGQLQPFELAITLIIADLLVIPMENTGVPLLNGIVPVLVITFSQMLFSYFSIKNEKFQQIMSGIPSIMIKNGKLIEKNLKKQNYNISELLEQLRLNGIDKITDIEYAMLETNGQLSVILKPSKQPLTPEDMGINKEYEGILFEVILDGHLISENLKRAGISEKDLHDKLNENNLTIPDVFYAGVNATKTFFIQVKE